MPFSPVCRPPAPGQAFFRMELPIWPVPTAPDTGDPTLEGSSQRLGLSHTREPAAQPDPEQREMPPLADTHPASIMSLWGWPTSGSLLRCGAQPVIP